MDFLEANRGGVQPRAVALRHERGEVPRVVAQARAWMAEQMLALAGRHGVPVRRDKDLLALLAGLETGDEIPPELYAAVAQVLVWLYRCNAELAAQAEGGAASERA